MEGYTGSINLHIIERVRFLPLLLFHVGWLPLRVTLLIA